MLSGMLCISLSNSDEIYIGLTAESHNDIRVGIILYFHDRTYKIERRTFYFLNTNITSDLPTVSTTFHPSRHNHQTHPCQ